MTHPIEQAADAVERELADLRDKLAVAESCIKQLNTEKEDAYSTLDAWFDRRKLGHEAVDQAVVDAAAGYLRTSRVGGMPKEESDLILGVIQDMVRLGMFADLFARAALAQIKGDDAELIERLRGWAKDIQEGSEAIWAMDQDLKEAADRIEALIAERDAAIRALKGKSHE